MGSASGVACIARMRACSELAAILLAACTCTALATGCAKLSMVAALLMFRKKFLLIIFLSVFA